MATRMHDRDARGVGATRPRQARREEQRRRDARRRTRARLLAAAAVLIVGVAAGLAIRSAMRPGALDLGEKIPGQGTDHILLGQAHPPYNSNPPTSGWHTAQTAPWGTHRVEIADEILVHNLEHGGIWISYRDTDDTELIEKLEALASRYRSKVIVTPRSRNDSPIAVAAWERLMKLDAYDEARIVAFIDAFRNKGPERVPD